MEYTISRLDLKNKRKLYDKNGNLKSVYSFDENNRNHGLTYMMCPYPNNDKISEIIEYEHGIIHGKRILIEYISDKSGKVKVYETWEHGKLVHSMELAKNNQ